MSAFIIHLLIPIFVVSAVGLFRTRQAWTWSWAAWAGDIDYLGWVFNRAYGWPNFHRALFHNIWLLLIGIGLGWNAWRRWKAQTGGGFAAFAQAKPGWVLVPFFYCTHLLLDLFQGGLTLFWPVSNLSVFWDFEINFDTTKPIPKPEIQSDPGTYAGVPDVSRIYRWMNAEQFAIFVLYLLSLALAFLYRRADEATTPLEGDAPK